MATLGAFGALVAVTQVSLADTRSRRHTSSCPPASATAAGDASASADASAAPGDAADAGTVPTNGTDPSGAPYTDNGVVQHPGDGGQAGPTIQNRRRGCTPSSGSSTPAGGSSSSPASSVEVLANNCDDSTLEPHAGFQDGNRCVSTEFGEVGSAENNPTLLISSAPRTVRANEAFTIRVSTRNLVRDRFLAAAQGGYYKESSLLTADGLVRGHFHTACRMLDSQRTAPAAEPVPAFFVATEDSKGGATPDEVTITVPGLPTRGMAQCAVWAGDGSHRIPMMQRANQIPAFDVTRIVVR
ncbi:hypothetical protein CIK06_08420 [Plantactinospora sp. KBS50]|nr:hypothetical protein CIK06_08420 [Plantactinospora sp. KBS50]